MTPLATTPEPDVCYPESDGKPMAENTVQYRWLTTIKGNLDILFYSRQDVFVAGDNLWYPQKGSPKICAAPDVYVVFGRPKRDRGSYKQWEEDDVPPAVVFEILSPSNTFGELLEKFEFYQHYGVQEYYIIDPEPARLKLEIYEREKQRLRPRHPTTAWISKLLGIRFLVTPTDLVRPTTLELFHPYGEKFLSFEELGESQKQTKQALDSERQRAAAEYHRAETEYQRAEKLAARLRELGVDPDTL